MASLGLRHGFGAALQRQDPGDLGHARCVTVFAPCFPSNGHSRLPTSAAWVIFRAPLFPSLKPSYARQPVLTRQWQELSGATKETMAKMFPYILDASERAKRELSDSEVVSLQLGATL